MGLITIFVGGLPGGHRAVRIVLHVAGVSRHIGGKDGRKSALERSVPHVPPRNKFIGPILYEFGSPIARGLELARAQCRGTMKVRLSVSRISAGGSQLAIGTERMTSSVSDRTPRISAARSVPRVIGEASQVMTAQRRPRGWR